GGGVLGRLHSPFHRIGGRRRGSLGGFDRARCSALGGFDRVFHRILGRGHGARGRILGLVGHARAVVLRLFVCIGRSAALVRILSIKHRERIVPPSFQLMQETRPEGGR